MKWVMKEPKRGDMIRVALGSIYHFGIFVSEDEVIQFGLAPSLRALIPDNKVEVLASDIDAFLAGGFLEVCEFDRKERKKHRKPDEVVEYARKRLGEKGYHILYNNCEHFANECLSGEHISHQADDVREMFRRIPVVDVYLAAIPQKAEMPPLSCALRQEEILGVSNAIVRREKYFVWRLLEYALERSFGLKSKDVSFQKEGTRYFCDKAFFSLSHGGGVLAVAVSRHKVGVDLEKVVDRDTAILAQKVFTPGEKTAYEALPEEEKTPFFFRAWTAKESLFKAAHIKTFIPTDFDTLTEPVKSFEKTINGEKFILSVATKHPEKIRLYENVTL